MKKSDEYSNIDHGNEKEVLIELAYCHAKQIYAFIEATSNNSSIDMQRDFMLVIEVIVCDFLEGLSSIDDSSTETYKIRKSFLNLLCDSLHLNLEHRLSKT